MKITNLNLIIKDQDGITPIPNRDPGAKEANLTFRSACSNSLLSSYYDSSGKPEEFKVKMEKYELHKKIRDAKGEVEVSIEELGLLKKWIGYWQPPLICGQCIEHLESSVPADTKKK
jgi:hypothetical protein